MGKRGWKNNWKTGRGGGRGGGGGRGKRGGGRDGRDAQRAGTRGDYVQVPKNNQLYENYYNAIIDESEREEFWATLKRDLPNSFRFCGSKGHALAVQRSLVDKYIPEIEKIGFFDSIMVEPPKPIPWYPDNLGWSMNTSKTVIRKNEVFAGFQKFLVSETSVGNISRQEVVSMIPPLLMDVRPGMVVLDMCASPGSKTCQLIEMIHRGEEARVRKMLRKIAYEEGRTIDHDFMDVDDDLNDQGVGNIWEDDGRATGLLIANDVDYKRAQMLVHQIKRLNSPNLIVTNHDATMYPSIRLPDRPAKDGRIPGKAYLKFDRILADVPCSGDGTPRKNQSIWKDWKPSNALGLQIQQRRILVRALQLLKVGGRVVYSTCSMNPVENEAVVVAAIKRCGGTSKVRIVDCSHELPLLKRRPGLRKWSVMGKDGRMWRTWAEVERVIQEQGTTDGVGKLEETMFPPHPDEANIPLERCMRVYPHQQDTGGFFIAALEKISEIRALPESEPKNKPVKSSPTSTTNHPGAPLMDTIDAIEKADDLDPTTKLDTLDEILPAVVQNETDVPAAARQNQGSMDNSNNVGENEISASNLSSPASPSGTKRSIDPDEAPGVTKRPKIRDSPDELIESGLEERQIHYPLPPSNVHHTHSHAPLHRPGHISFADVDAEVDEPPTPVPAPAPDTTINPPAPPSTIPGKASFIPNTLKTTGIPFEEAFVYLDPSHPVLESVRKFYDISPRFPSDRYLIRNASGIPVKGIYYTSKLAREILTSNAGTGMKFVHAGVNMYMKQDVQSTDTCEWRIQSQGLGILEPWVGEKRTVRLWRKSTFRKLVGEMFPKVGGGGWQEMGEVGEWARDISTGCCVLRVIPKQARTVELEGDDEGFEEGMVLPIWRSLQSLNLMLPKEDRKALILRLYGEEITITNHLNPKQNGPKEPMGVLEKERKAEIVGLEKDASDEGTGETKEDLEGMTLEEMEAKVKAMEEELKATLETSEVMEEQSRAMRVGLEAIGKDHEVERNEEQALLEEAIAAVEAEEI